MWFMVVSKKVLYWESEDKRKFLEVPQLLTQGCVLNIWGFPQMRATPNGWFVREILFKWMIWIDLGVPSIYGTPHMSTHPDTSCMSSGLRHIMPYLHGTTFVTFVDSVSGMADLASCEERSGEKKSAPLQWIVVMVTSGNLNYWLVNGCHEFCIFPLILGCDYHPNWLIFFTGVETTNQ